MKITQKKVSDLIPYERNPRLNEDAVEPVAKSIKEFGFKVPLVIDSEGVVITGHTRLKAAKLLGLKTVPCVIADDLNEEQVKAFRIADNKVGEIAKWDYALLNAELEDIEFDMDEFGFDIGTEIDWDIVEDLSEETYEEPTKDYRRCPSCGHTDSAAHFVKVKLTDNAFLEEEMDN